MIRKEEIARSGLDIIGLVPKADNDTPGSSVVAKKYHL
jgi:hypothetical protein